MTMTGTKWEKFTHYAKIVVVTSLVFASVGGYAYAEVVKSLASKDKEVLKVQLFSVQEELDTLKAKTPLSINR